MVQRPDCLKKNGDVIPGGFDMWNVAFAIGGPACAVQQTEQLTGVHIDHFVVVDFNGFRDMVDAIHGVEICLPEDVDDETGHIHLKAGTRVVQGKEALDYVRVRHAISQNGDIGRMKRQQVFIAAMASKVMAAETLTNPTRLIGFLRAATRSLTIDKRLGSVKKIADLASEFQDIGLDNIRFITVPWDFYQPDPNRLQWAPDADQLWQKIIHDKPLSKRLSAEAVTAAQRPGSTATEEPDPSSTGSPTTKPSEEPSRSAEEIAAENGLCA
jgi:LCP family protein required for cell wall assembly